ncbi:MAG: GH92 family glycosyl hydrolase [Bacteroidales bacterium]|nr:GH92 family glycosyl hydrolase [Bacteroidales bacterium]
MYLAQLKLVVPGLLTALVLLSACGVKEAGNTGWEADLLEYVDPFIGTGFHGHTFPGPVLPYGMVQLSPDTRLNGWDASSGYHYEDSTIYGFSHTHLSGTGIGDMGDILILPFTGEPDQKPLALFNKAEEQAKAGYYSVKFDNYNVSAELTATSRVGVHRYHYGSGGKKRLLVDLGHILQRTWGHGNVYNELEIIDQKTIRGVKHSRGWAFDHQVCFYAEFSSPFRIDEVIIDHSPSEVAPISKGENVYAYFSFNELSDQEPLVIKVSISPVDYQGAENNMLTELPGWDFEEVRRKAEDAWKKALGKIRVYSEDREKLTQFYTALYHTMMAPMLYQDVDGRYRGMDKKIHNASPGKTNYTVYSMWDTFRALHPLMTIIDEPRAASWVNNLLLKYEEGGFLPMWPLASNYTATMVGYPAVAIIADALAKGIPGIDKQLALEASVHSASYKPWLVASSENPRKRGLMPRYNKYVNEERHIPADEIQKSVSFGLEMAYYDWCIARIATFCGNDSLAVYFQDRSKYYMHYFDKGTGFMRGKNSDGSWVTPFNPSYSSHETSPYVEGNAWQWTWFVPHDIEGLIGLYGDRERFLRKLDTLFTTSSHIEGEDASADITGLIGQYAHGNEPSHHIAFLYTHAGQPWKTQDLIDRILRGFYSASPDGIIGNEDCGQMSAWYVLNAIGFYQVSPGDPLYTIGRPLFDRVEIRVGQEKTFTVVTRNNSAVNRFVQEVYLDGRRQHNLFLYHRDIMNGSTLEIVMGNLPDQSFIGLQAD